MSVYGKLFTETKSIPVNDICNEMNIVCAEFSGYNYFLDDFVNESSIEFVNEGVGEIIGNIFKTIKDLITGIIKAIGNFLSGIFGHSSESKIKSSDIDAKKEIKKIADTYSAQHKQITDAMDDMVKKAGMKMTPQEKEEYKKKYNKLMKSVGNVYDYPKIFKIIFDNCSLLINGFKNDFKKEKIENEKILKNNGNLNIDDTIEDLPTFDEFKKELTNLLENIIGDKEKYILLKDGSLKDFNNLSQNVKVSLLTNLTYYESTSKKYTIEINNMLKDIYNYYQSLEKKIKNIEDDSKLKIAKKMPKIVNNQVSTMKDTVTIFAKYFAQFQKQRDYILQTMRIVNGKDMIQANNRILGQKDLKWNIDFGTPVDDLGED